MRAWVESKGSLEGWWFESLNLSVRITKESDAHRGRARRAPRASQTSTARAPRASQTSTARAPRASQTSTARVPWASQTRTARAPRASQTSTARAPWASQTRTARAPRTSQARTKGKPDRHHAHLEGTWAKEWCRGIFWEFKLICIYLNISLCLLRHIDVSSRNFENGPYCSLRGGWVSQGG